MLAAAIFGHASIPYVLDTLGNPATCRDGSEALWLSWVFWHLLLLYRVP
jgi:hypothetical protein